MTTKNENETPTVGQVAKSAPPTEPSKQDLPEVQNREDVKPQVYVHLADGSVQRCYVEDCPTPSGTNAMFGHWRRGNKVYQVIGVYPTEFELPEE